MNNKLFWVILCLFFGCRMSSKDSSIIGTWVTRPDSAFYSEKAIAQLSFFRNDSFRAVVFEDGVRSSDTSGTYKLDLPDSTLSLDFGTGAMKISVLRFTNDSLVIT